MPPYSLVDGADIEAGGAADTAQRLAADPVGQRLAAAVVEEHDVELGRAIARGDPREHGGVGAHSFARGRAGQQLQEHLEIAEARKDLVDADQRDQGLRQSEAHPAVALGLDHGQRTAVSDGEVGPRDSNFGAEKPGAQVGAGGGG